MCVGGVMGTCVATHDLLYEFWGLNLGPSAYVAVTLISWALASYLLFEGFSSN